MAPQKTKTQQQPNPPAIPQNASNKTVMNKKPLTPIQPSLSSTTATADAVCPQSTRPPPPPKQLIHDLWAEVHFLRSQNKELLDMKLDLRLANGRLKREVKALEGI